MRIRTLRTLTSTWTACRSPRPGVRGHADQERGAAVEQFPARSWVARWCTGRWRRFRLDDRAGIDTDLIADRAARLTPLSDVDAEQLVHESGAESA